jgi:hypothetical protein
MRRAPRSSLAVDPGAIDASAEAASIWTRPTRGPRANSARPRLPGASIVSSSGSMSRPSPPGVTGGSRNGQRWEPHRFAIFALFAEIGADQRGGWIIANTANCAINLSRLDLSCATGPNPYLTGRAGLANLTAIQITRTQGDGTMLLTFRGGAGDCDGVTRRGFLRAGVPGVRSGPLSGAPAETPRAIV